MTVHFIGAGPGAPDLITVRGRELITRCPVCLYAGSIVPRELLTYCPQGARIVDTAPLSLDEIGGIMGLKRERVRSLERNALTQLKKPELVERFRAYWD